MKLASEDSAYVDELSDETRYVARVVGDSVLLSKCYELLGEQERARGTAVHALTATLEALATNRVRRANDRLDALLRAMYLAELAHRRAILSRLSDEFLRVRVGRPCDAELSHAYAILALAQQSRLADNSATGCTCIAAEIADGLRAARPREGLESVLGRVRRQIRVAEEMEHLRPWSDVWHYVVAIRVRELMAMEAAW